MNRRDFIGNSSILALPLLLKSCNLDLSSSENYTIQVNSDFLNAHKILSKIDAKSTIYLDREIIIVGGGLSGIAAAYKLRDEDFQLLELSEQLGGSSSSVNHKGMSIATGAHYDISYPENFGKEVLDLLKEIDVLEYLPWSKTWSFKDRGFIIQSTKRGQVFENSTYRKDILKNGPIKDRFIKYILGYNGTMTLPTRNIDSKYRHLNALNFEEVLRKEIAADDYFIKCMDYLMKDDYGAGTENISALAGVHYFACRPYFTEVMDIFCPPQGNDYFRKKLTDKIDSSKLTTNRLAYNIEETPEGFQVSVLNLSSNRIEIYKCKKLIYAGQKHGLKHISNIDIETPDYAPWITVNVITHNFKTEGAPFWQNEMMVEDSSFIGFIDSAIIPNSTKRIFTCYYCLPEASRNDLKTVESNKQLIADNTIGYIEEYFRKSLKNKIEKIFITPRGHGMPIPKPGYLFKEVELKNPNFILAGVDIGRLPLLYEALDSGILAAGKVLH